MGLFYYTKLFLMPSSKTDIALGGRGVGPE